MKTNAIVRIIIWSLVIVFLTGTLCSTLFGWNLNSRYNERADFSRAEDSSSANKVTSPPLANTSAASVNAADIQRLSIEWVAGDITIQVKEGSDQIRFAEDAGECNYPMVYKQSGEKLTIQFCKESFGFRNFGKDARKDLVVEVPENWLCRELELDVAAADLTVRNLQSTEVDFDGAAGNCEFVDCTIGSLDLDAAAGDVTFTGVLNELDLDAASGSFTGVFKENPRSISMDGMSAELEITLPADGGYTAKIDGMSGSITADGHTTAVRNGAHIYGDGSCRISLDGMSCDLTIRLDGTPAATP